MAVAAAVPMGGGGAAPVAAAVPMQQQAGYGGGAPAVAVAQPGYGAPPVATAQPGYGGAPPVATATAMPMGGGGAAPTMVMQKQQMRPSGGLDFLAQFGDLYIAQQVRRCRPHSRVQGMQCLAPLLAPRQAGMTCGPA
eukprot:COSAG01_NODE_21933_length_878_cov_5.530167_2_plen_138_part_00